MQRPGVIGEWQLSTQIASLGRAICAKILSQVHLSGPESWLPLSNTGLLHLWTLWLGYNTMTPCGASGMLLDMSLMCRSVQAFLQWKSLLRSSWVLQRMHPENDTQHINMAELDVILNSINMAFQWKARVLHWFNRFCLCSLMNFGHSHQEGWDTYKNCSYTVKT